MHSWMPKSVACYAVGVSEMTIARRAMAHRGRRLEYFTIAWNSLEGLIAVGAGMVAGSVSLVGFGMDSFIEVSWLPDFPRFASTLAFCTWMKAAF